MTEIEREIAKFPEEFGLRAFSGKFRINKSASYKSCGQVYLYIYTENGESFCKGTPEEIRRELV